MKQLFHIIWITACSFIISISVYGQQSEIDSLKEIFNISDEINVRLRIAEKLILEHTGSDRNVAIYYCEEAIKLAKKLRKEDLLGELHTTHGRLWEMEGYYLIAIKSYDKALEIGEENNNKSIMALSLYRIANTERKLCEYQNAIDNCFESLKLCEEIYDSTRLSWNLNCLGNIYNRLGEYEKAVGYYNEYLNIATQLNNTGSIAKAYNNLGNTYQYQSQYNYAREYFLKALGLHATDSEHRANTLNNLAYLFIKSGDFPEAKKYLEEAFRIRKNLKDKQGLVKSYYVLGMYYFASNSLRQAQKELFSGLEIALDIDLKMSIKDIYYLLHKIYYQERNYEEAYKYQEKYQEIYNDIFNIEKSKQIAYLELQYENQKIKEKEQNIRLKKNFIIAGSFIIALFIVIFILIHNRNSLAKEKLEKKLLKLEKKQVETSLDVKNKELTCLALSQAGLNEIIKKIKQDLTITKYNLKKENQQPIQSVINELSRNLKPDIWREFELRFIEVHKDFYTNLTSKFPDLTPNEQRLCALLRLNMSTKEISLLTNKSLNTIDIARSRLRKKLNLPNKNTGMAGYLSSI